MNSKFALVLAYIAASIAMPVMAEEDDTIFDRSPAAIADALLAQGVQADGLEEWGGYIRAWVDNGDGGTSMQFFDPATLQPVTPGGA